MLDLPSVQIDVQLPLPALVVRLLAPSVALTPYRTVVRVAGGPAEQALRSSLWVHGGDGWRIAVHQGTPCGPEGWQQGLTSGA